VIVAVMLVAVSPQPAQAVWGEGGETVTCPVGYICNPVTPVACPAGYKCTPVTVVCPAGYTCSPVQVGICPAGYKCEPTNPSGTTTPSYSTDATATVYGDPSLRLTYDRQNESLLTATFNVNVYGGTKGVMVYSNLAPGVRFVSAKNSQGASNVLVTNNKMTLSRDSFDRSVYVIPAGSTYSFTIQASAKPSQMFAGAYYAVLESVWGEPIPGNADGQSINIPTVSGRTNTRVIVGEKSPYISSLTSPIAAGQSMYIYGERLNNTSLIIDGTAYDTKLNFNSSWAANKVWFTLPSLASGYHWLQLVNKNTGASNSYGFTVGGGSSDSGVTNISLITPKGGEVYSLGNSYKIVWTGNWSGNDYFDLSETYRDLGKGMVASSISQSQAQCSGSGTVSCVYVWTPKYAGSVQIAVNDQRGKGGIGSIARSDWFTVQTSGGTSDGNVTGKAALVGASEDVTYKTSYAGVVHSPDWKWYVSLMNGSAATKTIKRMTLIHNVGGEGWQTQETSANPLGKVLRVLATSYNGQTILNYKESLGMYMPAGGSMSFYLYGEPASQNFYGGYLKVDFTDGTSVNVTIPSSTITPSSSSVVTSDTSPTASLTLNGSHEISLNVGNTTNYQWSSTNADSFASVETRTCPNGVDGQGRPDSTGAWIANTAQGSFGKEVLSVYAGCTWDIKYTARNSSSGKSASDTVKFHVNAITTPVTPTITASVSLLAANEDRVSPQGFMPGVGVTNKMANDWSWQVSLQGTNLGTVEKRVKSMVLYHNVSGEGWSTSASSDNDLRMRLYPLMVNGKAYQSASYDETLQIPALTANSPYVFFNLFGQVENTRFNGGRLVITFTDGTSVTATIPASSIVPMTITPTNTTQTTTQTGSIWDALRRLYSR
jgi:hypothetical protein